MRRHSSRTALVAGLESLEPIASEHLSPKSQSLSKKSRPTALALVNSMSYLAGMITDLNPIPQLAQQLGQLLSARHGRVTTAESCTGGGIAEAITSIPGASAWFDCGFVTYSNQAKNQLLGVPPELIATFGAVSEPVVIAMAQGARARAGADFSVAVSGIAGPDGGSIDKPVGTVWLSWADSTDIRAQKFQFPGARAQVRQQALAQALRGLIERLSSTV
jgi:nicotinamide-nucleotide amidase